MMMALFFTFWMAINGPSGTVCQPPELLPHIETSCWVNPCVVERESRASHVLQRLRRWMQAKKRKKERKKRVCRHLYEKSHFGQGHVASSFTA